MTSLDFGLRGPDRAPVLVLSNSLGTTQELWERQLPDLVEHFRVLTYDHPGHGASELPERPWTVESLARGLLGLIDELELDRVSLCGVSLGGMVGMALALEAPERIDRLVLSCTSAYLGPPEGWWERAQTVRREGMDAIADLVVSRWFTPELAAEEPETVARFRALLTATPPEGYARCCEAVGAWDARGAHRGDNRARTRRRRCRGSGDPRGARRAHRVADRRCPSRRLEARGPSRERRARGGVHERRARPSRTGGTGVSDDAMKTRREVLGDEHVDRAVAGTTEFTADFQDLVTRYAWGEIWSRPGLDRRTRSCVTITALVATGREHELAMHVRAALRNGLTPDEIKEVLLQCAVYCGVPAANGAFAIAQRVLEEESGSE